MIDGGLRKLFKRKFSDWQWTAIETGEVSPGTPDAEYCAPGGITGWCEFKVAKYWKVTFQPLQPAWINRRARLGGRVFIVVKRAEKELYIIPGEDVLKLEESGLKEFSPVSEGEPKNWDWERVKTLLLRTLS